METRRLLVLSSLTAAICMALIILSFPHMAHGATTPLIEQRVNDVAQFIEDRGLDVPDGIPVSMEYNDAFPNDNTMADASPIGIRLNYSHMRNAEARFYNEAKCHCVRDTTETYVIMHELLHFIQGVPHIEKNRPETLDDFFYWYEEGLVDAQTRDWINQYIISRFGKEAYHDFRANGVMGSSVYHENVQAVRKLSQKATGKMWRTRKAREWRTWVLSLDVDKRKEVILSVHNGE